MSAEIISLSKARKEREKAKAARTAAANRARFGRSKAQKAIEKAQEDMRIRRLELTRREESQAGGQAGGKSGADQDE